MTWRARAGRAFEVSLHRGGNVLSREIVRADTQGLIRLNIDPDALDPMTLRFTCHE